jgi:hypothetical protein
MYQHPFGRLEFVDARIQSFALQRQKRSLIALAVRKRGGIVIDSSQILTLCCVRDINSAEIAHQPRSCSFSGSRVRGGIGSIESNSTDAWAVKSAGVPSSYLVSLQHLLAALRHR